MSHTSPSALDVRPLRARADFLRAGPLGLFLFRHGDRPLYALSTDRHGRNLPPSADEAGWTLVRRLDLQDGEIRAEFDSDEAARALQQDGYALIGCPFSFD